MFRNRLKTVFFLSWTLCFYVGSELTGFQLMIAFIFAIETDLSLVCVICAQHIDIDFRFSLREILHETWHGICSIMIL